MRVCVLCFELQRIRLWMEKDIKCNKMIKKNFKEQIKDPRWQRRRLEIMQRDDFACQMCGDKESTLNVHHIRYIHDHDYWDYKDRELITLCEECHYYEHLAKDESISEILSDMNNIGLTNIEIYAMLEKLFNLLRGENNHVANFPSSILGEGMCFNVKGDIENLEKWRNKLNDGEN